MKQFLNLQAALTLVTLLMSCTDRAVYRFPATTSCSNLDLNVSTLFPDEVLELEYNDQLILRHSNDSSTVWMLNRAFCLDYSDTFKLSIRTFLKEKKYLDTTLVGLRYGQGYRLNITMPHPYNWEDYFDKQGVPIKSWGYLPIDSSIRFVSLVPDTMYKDRLYY